MIKDRNAENFVSEGTFDIAPGCPLLFTSPVTQSVGVEMSLPWIRLVPWHPHRQTAHEEFAKSDVAVPGAQQNVVIDQVSVRGFRRMNRNGIFLFQDNFAVRRRQ